MNVLFTNFPSTKWFITVLLLSLTVCLTACKSVPPIPANPDLSVTFVSGDATCSNNTGSGKVEIGRILKPGDCLITDSNSCVDLAITGNAVIRVKSASRLTVAKLKIYPAKTDFQIDCELKLDQGEILADVKKLSAQSKFEVKFSTGVIGVRGTTFAIDASGNCHVLDGSIMTIFVVSLANMIHENITLTRGKSLKPPSTVSMPVIYDTPRLVTASIRRELKEAESHYLTLARQ